MAAKKTFMYFLPRKKAQFTLSFRAREFSIHRIEALAIHSRDFDHAGWRSPPVQYNIALAGTGKGRGFAFIFPKRAARCRFCPGEDQGQQLVGHFRAIAEREALQRA